MTDGAPGSIVRGDENHIGTAALEVFAMLDDLRQRAVDILGATSHATLLTCGPADLQATYARCAASALLIYVLVPRTSDVLFNLEHRPEVLLLTPQWQLRGTASALPPERHPADLALLAAPEAAWCAIVLVTPTRLHWIGNGVTDIAETIDLLPAG